MSKKVIGVFGGSFNPPLNSHFSLAEEIMNEMDCIAKIIFVPVSEKYNKSGLASNEDRYNMLKIICDEHKNLEVSNIEHIQEKQLDTYETLELLQKDYPDFELMFITGTDNLKELYWWGKIDLLLENYKVIVVERDTDNCESIIESQDFLKKYRNTFVRYNQQIKTNLSSTYVRSKIKEGKLVSFLLPKQIYEYIKKNNLYKD